MKQTNKFVILGAGIAGLAAAAELKSKGVEDFVVIDKTPELPKNFKNGLHYLHSCPETPFPFEYKSIILTEEIWDTRTNIFKKQATIPEMFEYSKKVMENLRHPSSIMDPGKRTEVFVPENNNMDDLLVGYYNYIGSDKFIWNFNINKINPKSIESNDSEIVFEKLITTIPLNVFYQKCEIKCPYELKNKTLYITNYKTKNIVPNWLIALYMSDTKFPPYRITILNNIISMESLNELTYDDEVIIKYVIGDLFDYELWTKEKYAWETGRIFGLEKKDREQMLSEFNSLNIYPIGRFACWNGKLLIDSTVCQAKETIAKIS